MVRPGSAVTAGPEVVRLGFGASGQLTLELVDALDEACERARSGSGLVLRCTGTGAPPAAWPGPVTLHLVSRWEQVLRRVERLTAFTVCVLEGRLHHGALEVLLVTDHRLAVPDTAVELGGWPDLVWPGTALHRLVHQIGLARARRLMVLPDRWTAEALLSLGVVDDCTPHVEEAVAALTRRAAEADGVEIAARRRLLLDAVTLGYEEALGVHLAACDRVLRRSRSAVDTS